MSLGGASTSNTTAFSVAASTAAGRQALAVVYRHVYQWQHCSGILAPGLFDGFNIDWEFPTATDTQNFTALLASRTQLNALSQTTGKQYTLSFDGPAGSQNYVNIDCAKPPLRWISSLSMATTTPAHG